MKVAEHKEARVTGALKGIGSDYVISTIGSACVALSSIALFAWIGRSLGPEELGFFSQIRRVAALWVPVGTIGVSIALSRYIPRITDTAVIRRRAWNTVMIVSAVLALHVLILTRPEVTSVLKPVVGERLDLSWPFILQLCGLSMLVLPYAILRGLHRIRLAAALQVFGYALWPLMCLTLHSRSSLPTLVTWIGLGQLLLGLLVCIVVLRWCEPLRVPENPVADPGLLSWLGYGLARLPGGAFAFVLWAGVPMVLSRYGQSIEVALANAVTSLVNLPVMILSPLSFVLLPRLSLAQVQGEDSAVQSFLRRGLRAAWELQLPATLSLFIFLEQILVFWLGFPADSFIGPGRWMVLSIPAVTLFLFCRPAVDARAMTPYAVIAQGIGVASGGVWCLLNSSDVSTIVLGQAFFGAQVTAAICVMVWCHKLHDMKLRVPALRVLLQALPLLCGLAWIFWLGHGAVSVGVWLLALSAYSVTLYSTESEVIQGVLRLARRGAS